MSLALSASLPPHTTERIKSVEFTRVNGVPLYFDAAIPEGSGPLPAVIIVHGGGWVRGDRLTEVQPLFAPLTKAGFAWFSIDYRLSNDWMQFGAAIEDVESAVRFVKRHASEYRIDPDRVALVGESAGGQLAAMAALNATPETHVSAVVALYTPTDLVDLAKNSTLVPQQIRDSFSGTPFEMLMMARLRQLSPLYNLKRDAPPFLLIHGTADRLVPFAQSQAMCNRMKATGASCELYSVEGAGHGIRWWESSRPGESAAYKEKMVDWLQSHLSARVSKVS
ncbi:MAG: alpha/beta fold hydrolase [Bryobacteraceae bacterium]